MNTTPLSRRQFLKSSTAALATAALAPAALPGKSAAASPGKMDKVIGIQVGAISFVDEGTDRVLDILQERGAVNYYIAVGCVNSGQIDCAIDYLRRALDEGFVTRKKIESDAEFASLRNNPAFQQLLAEQNSQKNSQ